jgi:hypothetical protein
MTQPDFAHAGEELTATRWPAHLAGGVAAATNVLAWIFVAFVSPAYLEPYAEQGVVLGPAAQTVLRLSRTFSGVTGVVALVVALGIVLGGWRLACSRGGAFTLVLFVLAAAALVFAVCAVLACGSPADVALER